MRDVSKLIHIIAVAYKRLPELRVFIQSWINQTNDDWQLTIIHDGQNQEFTNLMNEANYIHPNIEFFSTDQRHNDYGHTLRDLGLKRSEGKYTILTNADNYFIPRTTEYISTLVRNSDKTPDVPDIILFDMIHSHTNPGTRKQPAYNLFKTEFKLYCIDVSSAAVRTELAKAAGFRDKTHDGDQTYFKDIASRATSLKIAKINRVLLIHN